MSAQKVAINFAKLPGAAAAPMICRNALTRSYMLPLTTLLSRSSWAQPHLGTVTQSSKFNTEV